MNRYLIRGLLGSLMALLVTFAVMLALNLYRGVVPGQVEHNTANITQADYAAARAKWNARNVSVYEESVSDGRLQFRMRVDNATGNLYLLDLKVNGDEESVDGLNAPLSGVQPKVYGAYSVDSIFDSIRDTLASVTTQTPQMSPDGSSRFSDFDVQLDQSGSYPTRLTEDVRTTLAPQEITWRTIGKNVQISDLTVIK